MEESESKPKVTILVFLKKHKVLKFTIITLSICHQCQLPFLTFQNYSSISIYLYLKKELSSLKN